MFFNTTTKDGYTSEIAAWLALSTGGQDVGQDVGDGSGYVTIDPTIYSLPTASVTVHCIPPCTYVMPPLTLASPTTFSFPLLTTSLEVGGLASSAGMTSYVADLQTTVITIPAVTTSVIPVYDVTITNNQSVFYLTPSIMPSPFNITDRNTISGTTYTSNTRTFYPPPWPGTTIPRSTTIPGSTTTGSLSSGLSTSHPVTSGPTMSSSATTQTSHDTHFPIITHTVGPPSPICTHPLGCGHRCDNTIDICHPCWLSCPGPPRLNWWDSNDPDAPFVPGGGQPDDACETSTYSSCSTHCVVSTGISTTATQTCSTTCRDVVGCNTAGTDDETYTTIACPALPTYTPFWTDGSQLAPILGDGGYGGQVIYGSMSIPSGIPATSSSTGTSTSRPVVSTSTRSDGGAVVYSISYITQTPTQVTVSVTVLTTTTITAPSSQSTVYSTTVITTTPTTVEASSTTAVVAPTLQAKCVVW